jgi:hypothetical protein
MNKTKKKKKEMKQKKNFNLKLVYALKNIDKSIRLVY